MSSQSLFTHVLRLVLAAVALLAPGLPTTALVGASAGASLDADGNQGKIVANSNAHTIATLRGLGDGTIELANIAYDSGDAPWALVVADYNSDGAIDLTVTNNASNDASLLLGAP